MLRHVLSARARAARGLTVGLFAATAIRLDRAFGQRTRWGRAPKDIRWGTGPAGSSGGKALVVLANILNKKMPEYRIRVLPDPGAVGTVKRFATGELDGYYGSDVALHEFARRNERFKGFKAKMKRRRRSRWGRIPSMRRRDPGHRCRQDQDWSDLTGKQVFTGPTAVRHPQAARERAGGGRRQARLQGGRSEDRRLAA